MTSRLAVEWFFPARVLFGPGRARELPVLLLGKGLKRPLVVTDRGLAGTPLVSTLLDNLKSSGLDPILFGDVDPNPTDMNVRDGAAAFSAHSADALVALGGGSGLDGGKSIAMVAKSGYPLERFEWTLEPVSLPPGTIPPIVTMPTTAGTGAEMASASMCTDTTKRIKICVEHQDAAKDFTVIADPELTLTLPPHLTAWTGMDAFTHAFEALCVDMYHPMCDGIALESMRLIKDWLPVVFADGGNLEGRSQMMAASSMAAVAFNKGLGATHGLSEPIGAVANTQHGLTNAVILPFVIRANKAAIVDKCELVARYLGLPDPPNSYRAPGLNPGFEKICYFVDTLLEHLQIPNSLRAMKLDEDLAAECAVKAFRNPTGFTNPIEFSVNDYERLYFQALEGRDRQFFS